MQIIRTLVWVLILVGLLVFTAFNWNPVEVTLWTNMVLETKIPALVVVSFLLGLVPMWLIHRGVKWRLERRIAALESAARVTASPPPPPSDHQAAVPPATTAEPTNPVETEPETRS